METKTYSDINIYYDFSGSLQHDDLNMIEHYTNMARIENRNTTIDEILS